MNKTISLVVSVITFSLFFIGAAQDINQLRSQYDEKERSINEKLIKLDSDLPIHEGTCNPLTSVGADQLDILQKRLVDSMGDFLDKYRFYQEIANARLLKKAWIVAKNKNFELERLKAGLASQEAYGTVLKNLEKYKQVIDCLIIELRKKSVNAPLPLRSLIDQVEKKWDRFVHSKSQELASRERQYDMLGTGVSFVGGLGGSLLGILVTYPIALWRNPRIAEPGTGAAATFYILSTGLMTVPTGFVAGSSLCALLIGSYGYAVRSITLALEMIFEESFSNSFSKEERQASLVQQITIDKIKRVLQISDGLERLLVHQLELERLKMMHS